MENASGRPRSPHRQNALTDKVKQKIVTNAREGFLDVIAPQAAGGVVGVVVIVQYENAPPEFVTQDLVQDAQKYRGLELAPQAAGGVVGVVVIVHQLVIAVPVALLEVIQERSVGLLILPLVREVVTGHVV